MPHAFRLDCANFQAPKYLAIPEGAGGTRIDREVKRKPTQRRNSIPGSSREQQRAAESSGEQQRAAGSSRRGGLVGSGPGPHRALVWMLEREN